MATRFLGRRLAAARFLPALASPRLLPRSLPIPPAVASPFCNARAFASKSGDSGLLKVLKAEIEHEGNDGEEIKLAPPSPFTIENKPGRQEVILRRSYNSEDIAVTCVFRVAPYDEEEEPEESDKDQEEPDTPVSQEEIHMVMTVTKGGDGPSLEISCTCAEGDLEIERVSYVESPSSKDDELAYNGPMFSELDENLQKQFYKYLEVRGVNDELCNFLVNYMPEKERHEYVNWLDKVEKFVRKEAK